MNNYTNITPGTAMIEVRIADLVGPALACAVAMVEGHSDTLTWYFRDNGEFGNIWTEDHGCYRPDELWEIGGPLIFSNQVFLNPPRDVHHTTFDDKTGKTRGCWQSYENWQATVSARVRTLPPKPELASIFGLNMPGGVGRGEGPDPLIAACRAIVASHHGEMVSVPVELIPAVQS